MNVSQYMQAINIEWFGPLKAFRSRIDEVLRQVKNCPTRDGIERIYYPGERGFLEAVRRKSEGIPLERRVFEELGTWSAALGITRLGELAAPNTG